MAFNHYAKIKRILDQKSDSWVIRRINASTSAKKFNGETVRYDYYYRIYTINGDPIKYCKFQQIDRLAKILERPGETLPVID